MPSQVSAVVIGVAVIDDKRVTPGSGSIAPPGLADWAARAAPNPESSRRRRTMMQTVGYPRIPAAARSTPASSLSYRSKYRIVTAGAAMGHLVSDVITLFVVVDPLAASSVFLAVTAATTASAKRRIATLAVLIAFGVLVFFIVLGQIIVESMGISLRSFQIAGGIVLFLFAASMVLAEPKEPAGSDAGAASLAVYPLAIPAIAGPGTMLTVMLLTDNDRFGVVDQALTTAAVAAVLLVQYLLLLLAEPVSRVIGRSGANILRRVMGMILAAVAVNAVLTALGSWLGLPKV
jgi:multiple antibiotic resistance protein